MAKTSPTPTDDDSEYTGPNSPPAASTIRTRAQTNCVKIETTKPHVTFDKNSLKPENVEEIKLKKSSIKSNKSGTKTSIRKPGSKGKGTPQAVKPGVPKKPAALGTQNTPKIDKLKDKNKKKSDKLNDKNKEKQEEN